MLRGWFTDSNMLPIPVYKMKPTDIIQLIWPLVFIVTMLVMSRRLSADLRPIFVNIVGGVAKGAQSNALAYGIALLFGISASLSAFVDVFKEMDSAKLAAMSWHQYAVCWAKIANPFCIAILAYATQNNFKGGGINLTPKLDTNPPIPTQ